LPDGNVELVKAVYRAVNEDDLPTFLAAMHPEVELTTSGVYPDFHSSYRGREGAVHYWEAARGLWDAFSIEIGSCEPIGDHVVAQVHQEVEGRDGIVVDHDWGHLFSFEDGLIREVRAYETWQAAKEAATAGEPQQG
jgi:ketosteroid isomerase-like protein